jgi:hypothetical protein
MIEVYDYPGQEPYMIQMYRIQSVKKFRKGKYVVMRNSEKVNFEKVIIILLKGTV